MSKKRKQVKSMGVPLRLKTALLVRPYPDGTYPEALALRLVNFGLAEIVKAPR